MTFVDRIADARDIAEIFDLVNEFVDALQHAGEIQQIPIEVRPGRISTADDLSYWPRLISEEIKRRDAAEVETPDVMFGLHTVLETALQRLRSDWVSLRCGPAGRAGPRLPLNRSTQPGPHRCATDTRLASSCWTRRPLQ